MNYWIISGLIVTVVGSGLTGYGYYRQIINDKVNELELIEYRDKSLKNQFKIIENSDITFEKTEKIHEDVIDTKETNKEILNESKEQFEIANRPYVIIENLKISPKDNKYVLYVKNEGKSMADIIKLHIDYSTPGGKGVINKWEQLPAGKTTLVQIDILHLYKSFQNLPDIKKEYDEYIEKFKKNERALIVNLKLEYDWNGKTFESRSYTIIHTQNELTLN